MNNKIAVDAGEAVVSSSPGTAELEPARHSEQPPASTAPLHTDTAGRSASPGSAVPCEECKGTGSVEGRNIACVDGCWICNGTGVQP